MKKYSVIVPFHSNFNLLTACVSALCNTLDFSESELIIVDNNAEGSQIDDAWKRGGPYKVIEKRENLMYPNAINVGAECASGEYLVFCDADTYVTRGFQRALVNALKDQTIGYASAKLLNMGTNKILDFGITSSGYNFPHPFAGRPGNHTLVSQTHYPLSACAACSAISRKLFYTIGGFDGKLVHSYSDIDLSLRLLERQYRTVCVADAVAYHRGTSTIGSGMSESLKEDTKGIFMAKHANIPVEIGRYLDMACNHFSQQYRLRSNEYFILDMSTIIDSSAYIDNVLSRLELTVVDRYRRPYQRRDAEEIDMINFIPYQIRNYRVPLLYFVDSFLAFRGNSLWKKCREGFDDIVVDRHANIEPIRFV